MGRASYKAPSQATQLNIPHGDRDAALTAEPDPSRRGDHPWHSPPSHDTLLAAVNPGRHEETWQGEGSGNGQRQWQQVLMNDTPYMLHMLHLQNRAGWGRRQRQQRQRRRKRYFNREYELGQQEREKGLMEQDPSASSSNGCGRQGGHCRPPVHGPQYEQPGEARWWGHDWRRNQQQQQCTEPLRQDQAGGQSRGGQEEELFWNVKKGCWVTNLHVPAATLREARMRLRPMNMAGYCLPGMCAPHNTTQYIMDQHEYTWRNEEEAAPSMSGGSINYSTVAENFPLMVPLPSTAQEDEGTSTEEGNKTRSAKMISTVKPKVE